MSAAPRPPPAPRTRHVLSHLSQGGAPGAATPPRGWWAGAGAGLAADRGSPGLLSSGAGDAGASASGLASPGPRACPEHPELPLRLRPLARPPEPPPCSPHPPLSPWCRRLWLTLFWELTAHSSVLLGWQPSWWPRLPNPEPGLVCCALFGQPWVTGYTLHLTVGCYSNSALRGGRAPQTLSQGRKLRPGASRWTRGAGLPAGPCGRPPGCGPAGTSPARGGRGVSCPYHRQPCDRPCALVFSGDCKRCRFQVDVGFSHMCPRRSRVDSKTLTRNTRLIAEALTRVIYNLTEKVRPPAAPAPAPPPSCPRAGAQACPPSPCRGPPRTCRSSRSRW